MATEETIEVYRVQVMQPTMEELRLSHDYCVKQMALLSTSAVNAKATDGSIISEEEAVAFHKVNRWFHSLGR